MSSQSDILELLRQANDWVQTQQIIDHCPAHDPQMIKFDLKELASRKLIVPRNGLRSMEYAIAEVAEATKPIEKERPDFKPPAPRHAPQVQRGPSMTMSAKRPGPTTTSQQPAPATTAGNEGGESRTLAWMEKIGGASIDPDAGRRGTSCDKPVTPMTLAASTSAQAPPTGASLKLDPLWAGPMPPDKKFLSGQPAHALRPAKKKRRTREIPLRIQQALKAIDANFGLATAKQVMEAMDVDRKLADANLRSGVRQGYLICKGQSLAHNGAIVWGRHPSHAISTPGPVTAGPTPPHSTAVPPAQMPDDKTTESHIGASGTAELLNDSPSLTGTSPLAGGNPRADSAPALTGDSKEAAELQPEQRVAAPAPGPAAETATSAADQPAPGNGVVTLAKFASSVAALNELARHIPKEEWYSLRSDGRLQIVLNDEEIILEPETTMRLRSYLARIPLPEIHNDR